MISCCKECKDRKIGCHANCWKYEYQRLEHEEVQKRMRIEKFDLAYNPWLKGMRRKKRGQR